MNPSLGDDGAAPGTMFICTVSGLLSALLYTAANIFLRAVADCDPIWVSAVKAAPNVFLVGPWLLLLHVRGFVVLPKRSVTIKLALAGLVGQLLGNVPFQWSLGVIGLAIAVPLCLGTIILGGALLGRIFLNEPLTIRTLFSVGLLIGAISVLSLGAGEAQRSVAATLTAAPPTQPWWWLAAGVAAAMCSGLAYAVLGVVIRYGVTGRASLAATVFTVGAVGAISLGILTLWQIGWEGVLATRSADMSMMLLAGLMNTAAFFALTKAFQLASVVYVNALNATQATMSAVAGVLLFHEALSPELFLGVALTIAGLMLMKRGREAASARGK
jgi:drug/metabolite transporter (DMT)-like permease